MPIIAELLDRFAGKTRFSAADLWTGYWQWMLALASQDKTGFATPYGNYCWMVAPMGYTNVPPGFQQLMWKIFESFIGVFTEVLVDDITIYSGTFEEHLKYLGQHLLVWRRQS